MRAPDPVLLETLRGMATPGAAHRDQLLYLFLQAVVLFMFWPKDSLPEVLASADRPSTLVASVIAAGFAASWYAARAGAGELLLPGQAALSEWAAATRAPLGRILGGYVGGQIAQGTGLVMLSLPLVLCAFSVSGGNAAAVAWCMTAVVFLATLFRLLGAAIHLAIGQHPTITLVCVRGAVLGVYLLTTLFVPALSHVSLSADLLETAGATGHPALRFIATCCVASALLLLVLRRQLAGLRRDHAGNAG